MSIDFTVYDGLLISAALAGLLVLVLLGWSCLTFIPNDRYGVVERRWSFRKGQDRDSFMSLSGAPGFIPEVIRGGWHVFFPGMYRIHLQELITVRSIGYLFARSGDAIPNGQALAAWPDG